MWVARKLASSSIQHRGSRMKARGDSARKADPPYSALAKLPISPMSCDKAAG